jgi:GNAT superfamily N-acetyltransferase
MAESDLGAVRRLAAQLGYEVGPEELAGRFRDLAGADRHLALVAVRGGAVVGWAHAAEERSLHGPARAYLHALVVEEGLRGAGVGSALLDAVEGWGRARGLEACALHSQARRADAHRFYERRGYARKKDSIYFLKALYL